MNFNVSINYFVSSKLCLYLFQLIYKMLKYILYNIVLYYIMLYYIYYMFHYKRNI